MTSTMSKFIGGLLWTLVFVATNAVGAFLFWLFLSGAKFLIETFDLPDWLQVLIAHLASLSALALTIALLVGAFSYRPKRR